MAQTAREEILAKLRDASSVDIPSKPVMPPLAELSWSRETMIEKFTEGVVLQTGVVHRVPDARAAVEKLTEIVLAEGLKKVMISADEVILPLDLLSWGKDNHVQVFAATDFTDRDHFKDVVFDEVEAGITGADYGIAETGTLVLVHNKNQPRLVSLAPIFHIAFLSVDRILPVYESALEKIFNDSKALPSQVTFITGPSMTADIQAVAFKGMHGPRKLTVILIG